MQPEEKTRHISGNNKRDYQEIGYEGQKWLKLGFSGWLLSVQ
jgi:hypothetical protein